MRKRLLYATLALAIELSAQVRGNLHITGEVQHDPSVNVNELWVELRDTEQHAALERAPVMNDGSFEFRNVATGNYEVRLVNRYGDAIRSEFVNLNQGRETVNFQLDTPLQKPATGSIAVSQLEHRVNRKALHEYSLAAKSFLKGDAAGSTSHLEKSIEADPQYAPAHHQLGVALLAQGQPERALTEFQKTVELDPALAIGHLNLAILLMKANRYREAETEARRASQLEATLTKAHFVLAMSLLCQLKSGKEALKHLRLAYEEFPQARAIGSKLEAQLAQQSGPSN